MASNDLGDLISDLIGRRTWAVVGVSADPAKFGYRVYKSLQSAGYRVYGVNPKLSTLEGETIYPSLEALPEPPEVVDMVVPPAVTEQMVRECARLGLRRVWLQPGAESQAALQFCREQGITVVHGVCAMVHKKQWPAGQ